VREVWIDGEAEIQQTPMDAKERVRKKGAPRESLRSEIPPVLPQRPINPNKTIPRN
jgi:hypothetical protein